MAKLGSGLETNTLLPNVSVIEKCLLGLWNVSKLFLVANNLMQCYEF